MAKKFFEANKLCTSMFGELPFGIVEMRRKSCASPLEFVAFHQTDIKKLDKILTEIEQNDGEPFVLVGTGNGSGFKKTDIVSTWNMAVDSDGPVPLVAKIPLLRPNFVVRTSDNHSHVVWTFNKEISPETADKLLKKLTARLDCDPAFARINQLVRLPGFKNGKYQNFVTSLVDGLDGDHYHNLDFFKRALDLNLECPQFDWLYNHHEEREYGEFSPPSDSLLEVIKSAIPYLGKLAEPYSGWMKGMFSLHSLGKAGLPLAHAFSKLSDKYSASEVDKKWASMDKLGSFGHYGTLLKEAMAAGWKNPGFGSSNRTHTQSSINDREMAKSVAAYVWPDIIATASRESKKRQYDFFVWDGEAYKKPLENDYREILESKIKQIIADSESAGVQSFLKQKIGKNRDLDEFCDHIAEALSRPTRQLLAPEPYYLAVKNGVINLLSGSLVPAAYRLFSRHSGDVFFDPKAVAPVFENTIKGIFEDDQEVISFIYRLFGYVMLGEPKHHHFVIFYGPKGRNGKSILLEIVRKILGDYSNTMSVASIMVKSHVGDGATPAMAKLPGKRLVIINEPNEKHELDAGLIKTMTGGETITARALYGEVVEFIPEFTPFMLANKIPRCPESDEALWRRLLIVYFGRTFSDEEKDDDRKKYIIENELSGVLNLLLKGVQDYLANGLKIPQKIKDFAKVQRQSLDPCSAWFADCAETTSIPGNGTELKYLWASYLEWSKTAKDYSFLKKSEFSLRLGGLGFQKMDKRNNPFFIGITLQKDDEQADHGGCK